MRYLLLLTFIFTADQISDPDRVMSRRERNVRQMMDNVTDPHRDQLRVIREIETVEYTMSDIWTNYSKNTVSITVQ